MTVFVGWEVLVPTLGWSVFPAADKPLTALRAVSATTPLLWISLDDTMDDEQANKTFQNRVK